MPNKRNILNSAISELVNEFKGSIIRERFSVEILEDHATEDILDEPDINNLEILKEYTIFFEVTDHITLQTMISHIAFFNNYPKDNVIKKAAIKEAKRLWGIK